MVQTHVDSLPSFSSSASRAKGGSASADPAAVASMLSCLSVFPADINRARKKIGS